MSWTVIVVALCLGAVGGAQAQLPAEASIEHIDPDVKACLSRTMPKESLRATISLRVFDDSGEVSKFLANLYWKSFDDGRSKALVRFLEPPHKSGMALLIEESSNREAEPEMTMYLPELRTTRRLVGTALRGSMFGTGFSYEDFAQIQGVARDHDMRLLEDQELDERSHYVIETSPKVEHSAYDRIVTYVDQQWCLPTMSKFSDRSGSVLKELRVERSEVHEIGGRQIPHVVTLHDHSRGARTEVVVEEIEVDANLGDLMFTRGHLSRGR
jgi:hypothetical protein